MRCIKHIVSGFILFSISSLTVAANRITICTDTNFWYPFTFIKNHEATGLHIDIIDKALRNLGFAPQYQPTSWQNCLDLAKEGKVDAVATASYRDDRANYLNYPAGAAVDRKSPFRVTEVEYVVITPRMNKAGTLNTYQFDGNVKTLPTPVRVPQRYSVAEDLRKEGLTVVEGKNALADFKSMLQDGTGSVVDLAEVAEHFATQPEFSDKYVVQKKPLNLKSYYLAFSKRGHITPEQAKLIWQAIANVRNDSSQMTEFLKKY